jgi:hypothetical protein
VRKIWRISPQAGERRNKFSGATICLVSIQGHLRS